MLFMLNMHSVVFVMKRMTNLKCNKVDSKN